MPLQAMARRWLAMRRVTQMRDEARARQDQDKRAAAVVEVCAMHARHALILNAVYSDDFAAAYTAMGTEGDDMGQRGGSLLDRAARVAQVNTTTPRGEAATPRRRQRGDEGKGGEAAAGDGSPEAKAAGDEVKDGADDAATPGASAGAADGGEAEGEGEGGGADTPRDDDGEAAATPRKGKKKKGKKKRRGRSKSPLKRGSSRFARSRSKSRRSKLAAEAEAAAQAEEDAKKKRRRRREAPKDVLPVVAEDSTSKEWVYPDYAMFEPEASPNPHWVRSPCCLQA